MNQNVISIRRFISCSAVLLVAAAHVLPAQKTNDEARLTLGIAAGYIGSTLLWDIPNQTVMSSFDPPDVFHLRREAHSDITMSGHMTYFGGPHWGLTGEFSYIGLGNSDGCSVIQDGGDALLTTVCNALNGKTGSASIVQVVGGMVYRPLSRASFQPYIKGLVGVAFTPTSTVQLESVFGQIGDTSLVLGIYEDDSWKTVRPTMSLGFGISTAPSSGYQLHIELRETWIPFGIVTEPTAYQGLIPNHKTEFKAIPSILFGFDIVLAKQRGRRY